MSVGHVFFISGVTGAGKGTLLRMLQKKHPNFRFPLSVKTRPLRSGEVDGVDYEYMEFDVFQAAIEQGVFLEYNFVHQQNYYGTRKDSIIGGIESGDIVVKEVDMLILPTLIKALADYRPHVTFLFLDLPESEIRHRMMKRGDTVDDENYDHRIASSRKERALSHLCDFHINAEQTPEEVYSSVLHIIRSTLNF